MSEPNAASHTLPLRNCYWVVPGLLLAGEHPNGPTRDKTKDRLKKLLSAGIECFVDLTKPTELLRYDTHLPFYVEYARKAIKDHGTPGARSQMVEILGHIANSMRAGRPVYVHCRAGIGRTGTVVGCLLVERGLQGNAAIDELNRLWQQCRRSRSWPFIPETDAQAQYVREWQPALEGGFDLNSLASAVATVGSMTVDGGLRSDSAPVGTAGAGGRAADAGTPSGAAGRAREPERTGRRASDVGKAGAAAAGNGRGAGQPAAVVSAADRAGGIGGGLRAAAEQARAAVERGEVQVKAPPVPPSPPGPTVTPAGAGAPPAGRRAVADTRVGRGEIAPSIRAEIADAIAGRSAQGTAAPNGGEEAAWVEAAAARAYARANGGDGSPAESDLTPAEPTTRPSGLISRPDTRPEPGSRSESAPPIGARSPPFTDDGFAGRSQGVGAGGVAGRNPDAGHVAGDAGAGAHAAGSRGAGNPGVGGHGASDSGASARGAGGFGAGARDAGNPGVGGHGASDSGASARGAARRQSPPAVEEPTDFDPLLDADTLAAARGLRERFVGTLFGLGVGDAVAAATQFRRPGTFSPVGDMLGGGPFDLPRGAWSDDTAMALCLAESLLERDGFDARDQVQRYGRWQQDGYMTSTGQCVGITASTARSLALAQWRRGMVFPGSHDPEQLDPEPLSRIAAVALFYFASLETTLQQSVDSSRITCQAPAVLDACRRLGRVLNAALAGQPKAKILAEAGPINEAAAQANNTAAAALNAALWAFSSTDNFRDAVLRAANAGGNSDVVAAVCGQLAGAHYGATAIPQSWRSGLMEKDLIEGIADRLLAHALVSLSS